MKSIDVIAAAIRNTFRSKLRTTLTVIAIFIGAFTLTVTSAIGAGVSNYIDNQLGAIGAPGVLSVSAASDAEAQESDGPAVYDPERASSATGVGGGFGSVLTEEDIAAIERVDGIERVEPTVLVRADYIQTEGSERYEISLNPASGATIPDLAAGRALDDAAASEILLPDTHLEALGFGSAEDALGQEVVLGAADALGERHDVPATIVGVTNESLLGFGASINEHLTDALVEVQRTGLTVDVPVAYVAAIAHVDPAASEEEVEAIKAELAGDGFRAMTTEDQIGTFQAVIGGIIGVLNAFAIIALIAAGFGIVNTLLMSVQERTREIGLMKAMGMSSGKVFGLFSMEAVFIGFLGSAIGAGVAILAGSAVSSVLADTLLSGLPGLQILRFDPLSIAVVILIVMAIAFLAGTLPARRAARQQPIDALRYE